MDFLLSKIRRDRAQTERKKTATDKQNKQDKLVTTLIEVVTSNERRSTAFFLDVQTTANIQERFCDIYATVYNSWEPDDSASEEGLERLALELYEELVALHHSRTPLHQLQGHCLQHFERVSGNARSFAFSTEISPEEFKYTPSRKISASEEAQPRGNRARSLSVVDEKDLEERGYLPSSSGGRSSSYG